MVWNICFPVSSASGTFFFLNISMPRYVTLSWIWIQLRDCIETTTQNIGLSLILEWLCKVHPQKHVLMRRRGVLPVPRGMRGIDSVSLSIENESNLREFFSLLEIENLYGLGKKGWEDWVVGGGVDRRILIPLCKFTYRHRWWGKVVRTREHMPQKLRVAHPMGAGLSF